jgi:molybdate transport system permease protein
MDGGAAEPQVAMVATLVGLPFGVAIAVALARGRFWGHRLLDGLVLLPLVLPPSSRPR